MNGDGFADLLIGAPFEFYGNFAGAQGGAAYVVYGRPVPSPITLTLSSQGPPAPDVSALFGDPFFGQTFGLGYDVVGAGDVNGDGFSDLVVSATTSTGTFYDYVVHGRVQPLPSGRVVDVASLEMYAPATSQGAFNRVAAPGDVNGDGYADLVLANGDIHLGSAAGISATVSGSIAGVAANVRLAGAGDLNGDGFPDLAAARPDFANDQATEGAAWVLYGNGNRHGRTRLVSQRAGLASNRRVSAWGASDASRVTASVRGTRAAGRGSVKLELQACPSAVAFGHASCVDAVSPGWLDTGASPNGVELRLPSPVLAPGLRRWRARVLSAPLTSALPGITPAPVHGPWFRLSGQAFEADVRIPVDGDADGVGDLADNCPVIPNAGQEDTDSDGRGDACDNCPADANANQADFDADLLGDVCDLDDDNDGLSDTAEATAGTNPFDPDSDDDGLLDGAEITAQTNPLDSDSDDDLVLDGPDNCKLAANASQTNEDTDLLGNACDNCPQTTNPDQLDRGGFPGGADGVGDACQTADLDRDGDVDIVDSTLLRRRLSGLEPEIDPSLP